MILFSGKFWSNFRHDPRLAIEMWRNRIISRHIASFLVFLRLLISEYSQNHCLARASGLAFALLLTLIPLMASASFMLAGVINFQPVQVQQIFSFLLPYAPSTIMEHLGTFFVNAQKLRGAGVLVLILMSVGLFGIVEEAMNVIFKVSRARSFFIRLRTFTMVMVYSPLLFIGSFHLRQSLDVRVEIGTLYASLFEIVSFSLAVLAFTTLNWYVPNMKVKGRSAFLGGLFAGLLFEAERRGFGAFIRFSGQAQTIYGAFGIQILFLMSLYVVSLLLLFGAEVTYVHQHFRPLLRAKKSGDRRVGDFRTYLSMRIFIDVVTSFTKGRKPPLLSLISGKYELTDSQARGIVGYLSSAGLIHEVAPGGFVPAKEFSSLTVRQVLNILDEQVHKTNTPPDDFTRNRISELFEYGRRHPVPELDNLTFESIVDQIEAGENKHLKNHNI
jgi:membrane protein